MLLLPFVDAVWQVYALIFVINACSAGLTPLFQATIPDVLPDEAVYTRALSLSRLAYDLQQVLAPALAGVLLWFLPLDALFAVNGAAFLISAVLVLSVMLPGARKVVRPEGVLANIGWGIRSYLATPRLQGLLALSMVVAASTAMVIVNTVVYVRDVLGGGDTLVTVAYAASGGGSMLAALLLPRVLDRIAERTLMLAGGAVMAGGMAAGVLMPSLAGLLAIWFLIGVGSSLVQTPGGRLLRRASDEEDWPAPATANAPGSLMLFQVVSIQPSERWTCAMRNSSIWPLKGSAMPLTCRPMPRAAELRSVGSVSLICATRAPLR